MFKLLCDDGKIKEVKGYRGDGTITGRRALPTEDCRLLVNLSGLKQNDILLDMFAGGGGIVFQAGKTTKNLISCDVEEKLSAGLSYYGAQHIVGKAEELNLKENLVDVLVTEVPFSSTCNETITLALNNIYKSLKQNAKIVLMCDENQTEYILKGTKEKYFNYLNMPLNRKGTSVNVLAFVKDQTLYSQLKELVDFVNTIF